MVLDSYLLRSLSVAGYAPDLADCVKCGTPGPHPGFSPSLGGVVCANCQPPGTPHPNPETIEYMAALLAGDWQTTRTVPPVRIREAAGLISAFVSWHMERGLRSLPLMDRQD
jgi:DNA repair protein RecO (recombination protein O)